MSREAKIHNNLTRKQLGFVRRLVKGDSATQAVMATYNTVSPKVASSIASENLNKPAIKLAIKEALRLRGLSLDVIVSNIGELANHKQVKISGETKLKANLELLKLLGVYPDKKNQDISVSFTSTVNSMTFNEAKEKMIELRSFMEEFVSDVEIAPHHHPK